MSDLLSKPWQKFFVKIASFDKTNEKYWDEYQILGYLCKRFKEHYNCDVAFSLKNAPSKCSEIVLIKKILASVGPSPTKTKQYIDFVFDKKIIPNKTKIKSIFYFLNAGYFNEFNIFWENSRKKTKSTEIPKEWVDAGKKYDIQISTWGELAFISEALKQDSESESRKNYKNFIYDIYNLGFDEVDLRDIK